MLGTASEDSTKGTQKSLMKFDRIVILEPVNLNQDAVARLAAYGRELMAYGDSPDSSEECIRRIGKADCVLVSYTTQIGAEVLEACENLRYVGMCCSLYTPESANVDIACANKRGITVLGVRDYGDEGVGEYVVAELVRILHGFGMKPWRERPLEIGGLRIGIIGMGVTGQVIAKSLAFFGAEIFYTSRTRKHKLEEEAGYSFLPLEELLDQADVLFTCLPRNTVILGEAEFSRFTGENGRILFNTSIGPGHKEKALARWLENKNNHFFCDTKTALGDLGLLALSNVHCMGQPAGVTQQAQMRLGKKVLENIKRFLSGPL